MGVLEERMVGRKEKVRGWIKEVIILWNKLLNFCTFFPKLSPMNSSKLAENEEYMGKDTGLERKERYTNNRECLCRKAEVDIYQGEGRVLEALQDMK